MYISYIKIKMIYLIILLTIFIIFIKNNTTLWIDNTVYMYYNNPKSCIIVDKLFYYEKIHKTVLSRLLNWQTLEVKRVLIKIKIHLYITEYREYYESLNFISDVTNKPIKFFPYMEENIKFLQELSQDIDKTINLNDVYQSQMILAWLDCITPSNIESFKIEYNNSFKHLILDTLIEHECKKFEIPIPNKKIMSIILNNYNKYIEWSGLLLLKYDCKNITWENLINLYDLLSKNKGIIWSEKQIPIWLKNTEKSILNKNSKFFILFDYLNMHQKGFAIIWSYYRWNYDRNWTFDEYLELIKFLDFNNYILIKLKELDKNLTLLEIKKLNNLFYEEYNYSKNNKKNSNFENWIEFLCRNKKKYLDLKKKIKT